MGLFDFLRRKPEPPPDDEGPSPDYVFVHYALRQIALSSPMRFLAIVASPDRPRFLESVLEDVAENCGRPTTFRAAEIQVHPVRVNDFPCAIIELPEPRNIAEAHMVAVVVPVNLSSDERPDFDKIPGRFFTLEKGVSVTGESRTVLCEWDENSHSNFGDGPPASVAAFRDAIEPLLV